MFHFLGQILVCARTIRQYGEISVFCIIPNGSPFPSGHICLCIPFVSVCCILCDLLFHLYHHILPRNTIFCFDIISPSGILGIFRQVHGLQWGLSDSKSSQLIMYNTKLYSLMRLQFWSSGESKQPLYCHYSQVHSDPEW